MFERVVIAVHPVEYPAVLLQQPDQLAAIPNPGGFCTAN
jgi:hypothetical protein